MAIVYAVKTGNWSDTTVWNTGALPTSADDVFPNTFTVTINTNFTVKSLSNTAATGVTAGGSFTFNGTNTIVADTITGGAVALFQMTSTNATITANTLTTTGTVLMNINNLGVNLTINGNINAFGTVIQISNCNTFTLNGNAIANSGGFAIFLVALGIIVVNGYCQGGSSASGLNSQSTNAFSSVTITKAISVNNCVAAVNNVNAPCNVTVKEIEQGVFGAVPISGFVRLSTASGAFYKGVTTGISTRTLSDPADIAGQVPAESDVRFGVTYQSGAKTGSAYIPAASSVGFGVPVDNTTGTAALTPASVWDAATSSLTTPGSIGERLKNASTVDTTGDQLAALL
jgi:hypothetical protein